MSVIFIVSDDGIINIVCDGEHHLISKEHPAYNEIIKNITSSKDLAIED
jgi:hypothetical protein